MLIVITTLCSLQQFTDIQWRNQEFELNFFCGGQTLPSQTPLIAPLPIMDYNAPAFNSLMHCLERLK